MACKRCGKESRPGTTHCQPCHASLKKLSSTKAAALRHAEFAANPSVTLLAYLRATPGRKVQPQRIAIRYSVPWAQAKQVLESLVQSQAIRRATVGGSATHYYIPTDAQLLAEQVPLTKIPSLGREYKPDPQFLERAAEARNHHKLFPSRF